MRTIIAGIIALILLLALGLSTSWFGLVAGRPMAKYQAETDRIVEQQSRRRVEGVNLNIGDLCLNMQTAADGSAKAYAYRIVQEANAYQGGLTTESQACISQAQALVR